jgi:Pyridoxal phosphate biosynthesis protein
LPAILNFHRQENCIVDGPFSADGFFGSKDYKKYDVTLAMYHDQALIPLKLLSFYETINVTLGLPIIRTSPGHGTGINIAKYFKADYNSFYQAIKFAGQMMSRHIK